MNLFRKDYCGASEGSPTPPRGTAETTSGNGRDHERNGRGPRGSGALLLPLLRLLADLRPAILRVAGGVAAALRRALGALRRMRRLDAS